MAKKKEDTIWWSSENVQNIAYMFTHPQTRRGKALRGAARRWIRWARARALGAKERAGILGRSALPLVPVVWSCALLRPAKSASEFLAKESNRGWKQWQRYREKGTKGVNNRLRIQSTSSLENFFIVMMFKAFPHHFFMFLKLCLFTFPLVFINGITRVDWNQTQEANPERFECRRGERRQLVAPCILHILYRRANGEREPTLDNFHLSRGEIRREDQGEEREAQLSMANKTVNVITNPHSTGCLAICVVYLPNTNSCPALS